MQHTTQASHGELYNKIHKKPTQYTNHKYTPIKCLKKITYSKQQNTNILISTQEFKNSIKLESHASCTGQRMTLFTPTLKHHEYHHYDKILIADISSFGDKEMSFELFFENRR